MSERQKDSEPKVKPIPREEAEDLYAVLETLMTEYHSQDLENARIGMAWHKGWGQDVDGRVCLARTRRLSELDQRLTGFDFMVSLNEDIWKELSEAQVKAVLDHELHHMGPKITKDGEQSKDTTGRYEWRLRRHEVEEFPEVIERHGMYNKQLEDFAKAAHKAQLVDAPLFAGTNDEEQEAEEGKPGLRAVE